MKERDITIVIRSTESVERSPRNLAHVHLASVERAKRGAIHLGTRRAGAWGVGRRARELGKGESIAGEQESKGRKEGG